MASDKKIEDLKKTAERFIKDNVIEFPICNEDLFAHYLSQFGKVVAFQQQNEWQVCPKCNGQGIMNKPPYVPGDINEWSSTTIVSHTCNLCNGSMIILKPNIQPE